MCCVYVCAYSCICGACTCAHMCTNVHVYACTYVCVSEYDCEYWWGVRCELVYEWEVGMCEVCEVMRQV